MKIFSDSLHKIAYSTDASAYREIPVGVAYPQTDEDIIELMAEAKARHCCIIPRAGGTSIAGQVVGKGIVADVSKYLNRILEINPEEKWARVQPGVVRDELNLTLKPYGLFFSPETSTSNRCCIGGMFGNNSCGTHSLVYGSTRDHVLEVKGILSDGSRFCSSDRSGSALLDAIYGQLESWRSDSSVMERIREGFPDRSIRRRSCGYAIDEALEDLDLCKLLAGSEGTLAFITEIKVSLDPVPEGPVLAVCAHFDTLEKSLEANLVALKHNPTAVELMDGKILELGKIAGVREDQRFFVEGDPAALLIAEFTGARAESDAAEFEADVATLASTCTRVHGADVQKVWALRKAGLGVLGSMKGDARPAPVIEDTAVAPERMPAYIADFREMLSSLGLECVYYGHISTGELHLRPILNMKSEEGRKLFREVAFRTAELVRKHRGSLSGEHGDGRLRGEFIPLMYGEFCYSLMRQVKNLWDPDGIFNTGKITDTPPMDSFLRGDYPSPYAAQSALSSDRTEYNWRAAFDECKTEGVSGVGSQAHALVCSVEQCNGAGDCRKSNLIGGTLCPTFKLTRDELRSTRARSAVLRELLTLGYESEALKGRKGSIFSAPEIEDVLYSCLACKGCRGECPSGVDMTKLRSEVLAQKYRVEGVPLRSFAVSRMALLESVGALVRPVYNFMASFSLSSAVIKKIVGFAAERSIPTLSRASMRALVRKNYAHANPSGRKVFLFADEFTNHQEAELGLEFARLLVRLGYRVEIPRHVESGRAAISKGCLNYAKKMAVKNVRLLKDLICEDTPLVGIEPSCILSFRDEYPDLVPAQMREDAKKLAENCLLFDEFLVREIQAGRITSESFRNDSVEIWLHGHCHQKALVGTAKTEECLKLLSGARVHVIPSGCCGMAGSFGYEKEHYKTSLEIGEMVLFPAVRKAVAEKGTAAVVLAPGTSCRQQIFDGTGVRAVHPITLLEKFLN